MRKKIDPTKSIESQIKTTKKRKKQPTFKNNARNTGRK